MSNVVQMWKRHLIGSGPNVIKLPKLKNGTTRAGCQALGESTYETPSPIVAKKKMENVNQFGKIRKWRSENTVSKNF